MAKLLKGAEAAKALTECLQRETEQLAAKGVIPCLAIVRVGNRDDDIAYERGAMKRCEKVGIAVRQVLLPEDVTQEKLVEEIEKINGDRAVHGALLLLPLPKHIDERAVRAMLAPEKDVDGITDGSMAAVYAGRGTGFAPCTAQACVELLKYYGVSLEGKRVTVVGRSLVIGKPVSMLLLAEHATVTICHSHSENLEQLCREADILVIAAGKAEIVGADHIREGQVILDVGIHAKEDGTLCGDVRFDEVESLAEAITPVPGGVGAVTTAMLASHVIEAAKRANA